MCVCDHNDEPEKDKVKWANLSFHKQGQIHSHTVRVAHYRHFIYSRLFLLLAFRVVNQKTLFAFHAVELTSASLNIHISIDR